MLKLEPAFGLNGFFAGSLGVTGMTGVGAGVSFGMEMCIRDRLVTAFAEIGVSFTEADMPHYEVYNNRMWEMFERGEIEKEHIYEERFRLYFAERGIEADTAAFNRKYLYELAESVNFMPHCAELLRVLHGRVKVFILTNGDTYAQERRIEKSGFAPYFDGVFISEQLGCKKPEKAFYDKVFSLIGEEYRGLSLIHI